MNFRYLKIDELPNGDLRIKITKDGRRELADLKKKPLSYDDILWNLLEDSHCNGQYTILQPEQVGALTSAPIIAYDVSINDDGEPVKVDKCWWFPNYMVQDEYELLKSKDGWILSNANNA